MKTDTGAQAAVPTDRGSWPSGLTLPRPRTPVPGAIEAFDAGPASPPAGWSASAALRRLRGRRDYVPGDRPVAIAELVSPLRLDILIRAEHFRFLAERLDTASSDFGAYVEEALETPYHLWFRRVALPRYHPQAARDPVKARRAFEQRLRRSIRLYRRFAQHGFDRRYPISLTGAEPGATTTTGKRVRRELYAGDGCHRLALLLNAGETVLPAAFYRVAQTPRTNVIDNTRPLISLLSLDRADYVRYLSLGYSDQTFVDLPALLADVERRRPDRLEELTSVLAVDGALAT